MKQGMKTAGIKIKKDFMKTELYNFGSISEQFGYEEVI